MLRVRLAGSLRLESGGRGVPPPRSRRGRALLAYLAAHPGAHSRGALSARFWPDVLDESARASLRAALTELRQALGPEAASLVATRDTVALDGAWVDLRDDPDTAGATLLADMDDDWVHELRRDHDERTAREREVRARANADTVVAAISPPGALTRAGDERFVGREDELAMLAATWADVRANGTRRLMLVAGEPGVGKTRMALRFARAALEHDGAAVLLGRCSEDPIAPYEPFADVLRQIGPEAASAFAGAEELTRLLGEASAASPDDPGARHRLFAAL